jgi:hypothetical protein
MELLVMQVLEKDKYRRERVATRGRDEKGVRRQ